MKKRKKVKSSKEEDKFYEFLCDNLGKENFERHKVINDFWSIDLFYRPRSLYVQFDGIYWHGLDRSLEEIKNRKCKQGRQIYKKYQIDRRQEVWFKKNNISFIRIPFSSFDRFDKDVLIEIFLGDN